MPRKYRRHTRKASWTSNQLETAIIAVKNGKSVREASKIFEIPRTSLQVRVTQNSCVGPSLGRIPVFSTNEEKELVELVNHLSKAFYGISRQEIKKYAYEYAQKNNIPCPFNTETRTAGNDWLKGFMQRNSSVILCKKAKFPSKLTAFKKEEVTRFFIKLEEVQAKYDFKTHRIFNMDETGISTAPNPRKLLAKNQVGFVTNCERERNITIVCAFSASGIFVPPLFIYPKKLLHSQFKREDPPEIFYSYSEKGWITEDLFLLYLQHFQQHVKAGLNDPVLLVIDNHSTHRTLQAYEFCKANSIVLLIIPPHTSHRIQPLDVGVYEPLKTAFDGEYSNYLKKHPHEEITPFEMAKIFNNAYMSIATPEKTMKAFLVTGIFPCNRNVITEEEFEPAQLCGFDNPNEMEEPLKDTHGQEQRPGSQQMYNFDDLNSVQIKLEKEQLVIKDELEEVMEECSSFAVTNIERNPSVYYIKNLLPNNEVVPINRAEVDTSKTSNEMLTSENVDGPPPKRPYNERQRMSAVVNEPRKITTDSFNKPVTEDEYVLFGRSIGAQLKTLSRYNAIQAQAQIQSVLTSFKLQELQSTSAPSPAHNTT